MIELRTYAGSWTISQESGSESWCTPDKVSGTTSSSFYVETKPNGGLQRETVLTISAPGCKDIEVTVTQNGEADAQLAWVPEQPDAGEPLVITYKPDTESDLYGYDGDLYDTLEITPRTDGRTTLKISWADSLPGTNVIHGTDGIYR